MSDLPQPTWHKGMYGCPQDMFTAEQMRAYAQQVREQVAAEIHADGHDPRCPSWQVDAECTCGADECAAIARGGAR